MQIQNVKTNTELYTDYKSQEVQEDYIMIVIAIQIIIQMTIQIVWKME